MGRYGEGVHANKALLNELPFELCHTPNCVSTLKQWELPIPVAPGELVSINVYQLALQREKKSPDL